MGRIVRHFAYFAKPHFAYFFIFPLDGGGGIL